MFKKISAMKKAISKKIIRRKKKEYNNYSFWTFGYWEKYIIAALLLKNFPDMQKVITATSRKPRSYETKADYIFLKEKQLRKKS